MARKKTAEAAGSDLARAIRQCVDSGRVAFGANTAIKRALSGSARLLIYSRNCPKDTVQDALRFCRLSGIPALRFDGTSLELGTVAGRPHAVSLLTVFEAGNSGILEFAK
jgi:large subunit ribosomal protein L30e